MITLITGAPGAGKSAACVRLLTELGQSRPIFVDGIPELGLDHQPLKDPHQWMTEVPDGALVVIDEVQRIWRPAGAGARVPDDIAALETHRHRGLDFILITQHPKLVHNNVRQLVGRHIHLRDLGILGRRWYEWPEASDPSGYARAPHQERYKLPAKVFSLYRSATEHIKPVRKVPRALIVAGGALVVLGGLAIYVVRSISARVGGEVAHSPAAGASAPAPGASASALARKPSPADGGAAPLLVYRSGPARPEREPYEGRAFRVEGELRIGHAPAAWFGVYGPGELRLATVSHVELARMGYVLRQLGPCSWVLRFGGGERTATCGPARVPSTGLTPPPPPAPGGPLVTMLGDASMPSPADRH